MAFALGGATFCLYFILIRHFAAPRLHVQERIAAMSRTGVTDKMQKPVRSRRFYPHGQSGLIQRLDNALRKADIQIPVQEYITRWVAITVCFAIAGYLLAGWSGSFICVASSFAGTAFYLRFRCEYRLRRFNDGLQDMLIIISNSMRAGHSFAQSLHIVCEDLHGPIQMEMQRVEQETQVGLSMEEALLRASERIGSEDFDLIVTAIGIQRQVGGNLSDVLDKIANTIRDRVRLEREVKTLTAQGRISAFIFMLMPVSIGCILYLVNPSYMSVMITSLPGLLLLCVAFIGQVVGYLFIRKIINVTL